jgi:hypothetical protein
MISQYFPGVNLDLYGSTFLTYRRKILQIRACIIPDDKIEYTCRHFTVLCFVVLYASFLKLNCFYPNITNALNGLVNVIAFYNATNCT